MPPPRPPSSWIGGTFAILLWMLAASRGLAEQATVTLSGQAQKVQLYRPAQPRSGVVLSSGDLGWAGFVVDVAEFLSRQGVAVLGFNTRAYLESFTHGKSTLPAEQVPVDYAVLAREARRLLGISTPPALVGISEGAGLSVIAASDEASRKEFLGVVCVGLPDSVELGWRAWRDWTTWITKSAPKEPHADLGQRIDKVAPLPLAMVQSTRDEFVPLSTSQALFSAAGEPKKLYLIDAANHRFSDKRDELHARLNEALQWLSTRER
jgi:alpha-beta hydrolase superfamily lysophospholipase